MGGRGKEVGRGMGGVYKMSGRGINKERKKERRKEGRKGGREKGRKEGRKRR